MVLKKSKGGVNAMKSRHEYQLMISPIIFFSQIHGKWWREAIIA